MQISPKLSIVINFLLLVLGGIGEGVVKFTGLVPAGVDQKIAGWSLIGLFLVGALNMALHGYAAPTPGPLVSKATLARYQSSKIYGLLLAFLIVSALGAAFAPAPVHAQQGRLAFGPNLTKALEGRVGALKITTPDEFVQKVVTWAANDGDADLTAASNLATKNDNQVTGPCWTNLKSFVDGVKALPTNLPALHIAVDIQILSDLEIALQPNSKILITCGAVATQMGLAGSQMVTGIVTGAITLTKLPIPALAKFPHRAHA